MSTRELVVLGTASQVPTRHRNHNGYLLLWDGQGFLFDPGEGTQRQMLFAGVSASQITTICVTHFHGDHSLGLAGIVQRLSLDGITRPIRVFFPGSGMVYFDRLRRASIFLDLTHLEPRPLTTAGLQADGDPAVWAAPLQHTVEAWGFRVQEPDRWRVDPHRAAAAGLVGPAIGEVVRHGAAHVGGQPVRIEDIATRVAGTAMAFVMDTALCDAAIALARGVDLLVAESTYLRTEADEARARGHMTASDAAVLAREAGVKKLVLTHFSQRHPEVDPFVDEARTEFAGPILAARDGIRIGLRASG